MSVVNGSQFYGDAKSQLIRFKKIFEFGGHLEYS